MMKRVFSIVLALALVFAMAPAALAASTAYSDVPSSSWAVDVINDATEHKLMEGVSDGVFGYGKSVTRAQFTTMICRMFGWSETSPATATFSDVPTDKWYYKYVETALSNGAFDADGKFRPDEAITREDMAVMLVRGLGYKSLASQVESYGNDFTDVKTNVGYITIAKDIGMVEGTGGGKFNPQNTAKREEAAAMLVRVYKKYISETQWTHGFYAISSYSQKELAAEMDAVSLGWSRMVWDSQNGARLNTTTSGGNEYSIPTEYSLITNYLDGKGTKAHLSVFMTTAQTVTTSSGASNSLRELLKTEESRTQAVTAIIEEATRTYDLIGKSPYSGVTIDFEGLFASDKGNFTAFIEKLAKELKSRNMTLYVAVHAALPDGEYYDGYDYKAIGAAADKLILMAHDYSPTSLSGFEGSKWHENTPLTPFAQVYYALRAVTDPDTGVSDSSKVVLAISFTAVAWQVGTDGFLSSATPQYPAASRVYERMNQADTVTAYSDYYRNPYMTYKTDEGQRVFLWYENEQSVSDKLELARLFGIDQVSVWRLGLIPEYDGYNVWKVIE